MTREDINDIINAICPNDEDYEKPCISPKYLRQELEQLALDQRQWNEVPTTKNDLGVDCIDRQATLDAIIKRLGIKNETYLLEAERTIYQQILAMPSVTPQEPIHGKCNQCKHYEGVHNFQGHAPCSYHKIGGVMWNWYCSQFESEDNE